MGEVTDSISIIEASEQCPEMFPEHLKKSFLTFENSSRNLCWLDASMCLLVHSKTLSSLERISSTQVGKIVQGYISANSRLSSGPLDNEKIEDVRCMLRTIQESSLEFLQPILKCENGKPDSAFCSIFNLINETNEVKTLFEVDFLTILKCAKCSFVKKKQNQKSILTLTKVNMFCPENPVSLCMCPTCKEPDQEMKFQLKTLPQCLLFHFENGAGNKDILESDQFTICDRKYHLTGLITLEKGNENNHFLTWVRDCQSGTWLECNDLIPDAVCFSMLPPVFVSSDIHIIMYEALDGKGTIHNQNFDADLIDSDIVEDSTIPVIDLGDNEKESNMNSILSKKEDKILPICPLANPLAPPVKPDDDQMKKINEMLLRNAQIFSNKSPKSGFLMQSSVMSLTSSASSKKALTTSKLLEKIKKPTLSSKTVKPNFNIKRKKSLTSDVSLCLTSPEQNSMTGKDTFNKKVSFEISPSQVEEKKVVVSKEPENGDLKQSILTPVKKQYAKRGAKTKPVVARNVSTCKTSTPKTAQKCSKQNNLKHSPISSVGEIQQIKSVEVNNLTSLESFLNEKRKMQDSKSVPLKVANSSAEIDNDLKFSPTTNSFLNVKSEEETCTDLSSIIPPLEEDQSSFGESQEFKGLFPLHKPVPLQKPVDANNKKTTKKVKKNLKKKGLGMEADKSIVILNQQEERKDVSHETFESKEGLPEKKPAKRKSCKLKEKVEVDSEEAILKRKEELIRSFEIKNNQKEDAKVSTSKSTRKRKSKEVNGNISVEIASASIKTESNASALTSQKDDEENRLNTCGEKDLVKDDKQPVPEHALPSKGKRPRKSIAPKSMPFIDSVQLKESSPGDILQSEAHIKSGDAELKPVKGKINMNIKTQKKGSALNQNFSSSGGKNVQVKASATLTSKRLEGKQISIPFVNTELLDAAMDKESNATPITSKRTRSKSRTPIKERDSIVDKEILSEVLIARKNLISDGGSDSSFSFSNSPVKKKQFTERTKKNLNFLRSPVIEPPSKKKKVLTPKSGPDEINVRLDIDTQSGDSNVDEKTVNIENEPGKSFSRNENHISDSIAVHKDFPTVTLPSLRLQRLDLKSYLDTISVEPHSTKKKSFSKTPEKKNCDEGKVLLKVEAEVHAENHTKSMPVMNVEDQNVLNFENPLQSYCPSKSESHEIGADVCVKNLTDSMSVVSSEDQNASVRNSSQTNSPSKCEPHNMDNFDDQKLHAIPTTEKHPSEDKGRQDSERNPKENNSEHAKLSADSSLQDSMTNMQLAVKASGNISSCTSDSDKRKQLINKIVDEHMQRLAKFCRFC